MADFKLVLSDSKDGRAYNVSVSGGSANAFIGKRIPNANPFQAGVAGPAGAASFFMTQSEDTANAIGDLLGTRYIVTDIEMDSPKFWAMATWFNTSASDAPYNPAYYVTTDQSGGYQLVKLNNQSYYETMVSRLHKIFLRVETFPPVD
jgi:dolichyl-diphosphooligosaccharide--protein glycosyltransferase